MNNSVFCQMAEDNLFSSEDWNWDQVNHHTWSCKSEFEFLLVGLTIQHFISNVAEHSLFLKEGKKEAFEIAPDHSVPVLCEAIISFVYKGELFNYHVICEHGTNTHTLRGNGTTQELVKLLEKRICDHNPFRGQYLRVTGNNDDLKVKPLNPPMVSKEQIVLPNGLSFDLLERDIINSLELGESCGSIFYGVPGVGKSLACRYLAGCAKQVGITTVEIISRVDYTVLQYFTRYLGPTLLLLEDIDVNVGESRSASIMGSGMSEFLQSLSGISEGPAPVSIVATTNDIELLDKAISNRPGRFNRKWEFKLPEPENILELVEVYFGKNTLLPEQIDKIIKHQFTGDLVRELHRTARLCALQKNLPINDCFNEALQTIKTHFNLEGSRVGFLVG